jgi:superfamily II DNA or RNA helicase
MTNLATVDNNVEELFYGDKKARWYQIASMHQVEDAFVNHGAQRICLVSATGSGKTVNLGIICNSEIIRKFCGVSNETLFDGKYKEDFRVLFVAHRDRLLQQAVVTFAASTGVELIPQSCFSDIPAGVLQKGWHMTVMDEGHHEGMSTIQYQLENYTQGTKNHLGFIPLLCLTATPDRADGMLIKFDTIITAISREQAVAEGWLAETYLYSFVDPTNRANKVPMLTDIFEHYHHVMGRGIAFVATKVEATELTENIRRVTGKRVFNAVDVSDKVLNKVLDEFSLGQWDFIVNCGKLGEGVDVKGCESVIIGMNIGSHVLLNQICGRAARPDSDCRIFELVNPLKDNLDVTVIVGEPKVHKLIYKRSGKWVEREFDYSTLQSDDSFDLSANRL